MVVVQASKLRALSSNSSSPAVGSYASSISFEPNSSTVALTHSDSSISLHHHHHHHQTFKTTTIPAPTSSSTFLHCQSEQRTLFIVSSPHLSKSILLRFYLLSPSSYINISNNVVCKHKGFTSQPNLGLLLDANHGLSVKLYAAATVSLNVFALYSLSLSRIWIFAVRIVVGDHGGVAVRLIKTSEIQCSVPVWYVSLSNGYFMLGEDNGVRIFALRPLIKGCVRKDNKHRVSDYAASAAQGALVERRKIDAHHSSEKLRPMKIKSNSSALFVAFKTKEVEHSKATTSSRLSAKAITIQALSPNKFLILDSLGDLHLLHLSSPLPGSNLTFDMRPLTQTMKVQKLAFLQDIALRAQTVWITDGSYSVHMMDISDTDNPTNKNDKPDSVENLMQLSVNQAIFTGEKIQDIASLSANAVLILGQGGVHAYEFS